MGPVNVVSMVKCAVQYSTGVHGTEKVQDPLFEVVSSQRWSSSEVQSSTEQQGFKP